MTRKEAIEFGESRKGLFGGKMEQFIQTSVEALKEREKQQKPCDAISRADAIRIASGYCHPVNIPKELAKLPPAQSKTGQWIPVSERLPEYGEAVLTYLEDDEEYQINWVTDDETGEWFYENPTAWMPLPEPYEPHKSEE